MNCVKHLGQMVLKYRHLEKRTHICGDGAWGQRECGLRKVSTGDPCVFFVAIGRTEPFVFEVYLPSDPVERGLRRSVCHATYWKCDHDPADTGNDGANGDEARGCALLEEVSHGLEEYDGSSNVDLEEWAQYRRSYCDEI